MLATDWIAVDSLDGDLECDRFWNPRGAAGLGLSVDLLFYKKMQKTPPFIPETVFQDRVVLAACGLA